MNGNLRADKKKCLAQFLKVQSIHCSHPSNSFIIHVLFFPILIFSCSLLKPTNVSILSVSLLLAYVPIASTFVFVSIRTVLQAFNLCDHLDIFPMCPILPTFKTFVKISIPLIRFASQLSIIPYPSKFTANPYSTYNILFPGGKVRPLPFAIISLLGALLSQSAQGCEVKSPSKFKHISNMSYCNLFAVSFGYNQGLQMLNFTTQITLTSVSRNHNDT